MKSIATNIVANFTGKIFVALLAILLVPVYIRYLGIENYGLVGFYTTLINAVSVLDLGLSTTLTREISKSRAMESSQKDLRNLVFSMECIYWIIGIVVCLCIVLFSGFIAGSWLNAEHISFDSVKTAIILMGIVLAVQWPLGFYHGGFMGIEKQVLYNMITVVMMTLRSFGALIVLSFISPTIEAFFVWQVIVNLGYVIWLRVSMWANLSKVKSKVSFSFSLLKNVWRFAAGMTGTAMVTFFLTQADKIVLSKILSLQDFAYYSLAFTVSSSLAIFIMPVTASIFPRFVGLSATDNVSGLSKLYHLSSRLIATIIIPICLTIIFFAPEILNVWLKDTTIVENTALLTRFLVAGSLFNALMMAPYLLTVAKGWTKFGFYQNLIIAILVFPSMIWLVQIYGGIAAAMIWMVVNAAVVVFSIPIIHAKVLRGQSVKWYFIDNLFPLIFAAFVCAFTWYMYNEVTHGFVFNYIGVALLFMITVGFTFLQFPGIKGYVLNFVRNLKGLPNAQ